MRASELCGLRLRDLDPGSGILYARGKGDKERAVPTWVRRAAPSRNI